jgi:exo-beta-1,3-glucanase (GH17 family)
MFKKIILLISFTVITACGGKDGNAVTPTKSPTPSPTPTQNQIHGINYDPSHSQAYLTAQSNNNVETMKNIIDNDLKQISAAGFNVIKSYYSEYCDNGGQCINITDEVAKISNLKIALGVFEFNQATGGLRSYTTTGQIPAAITAINNHRELITAVIVGNEDIANSNHLANLDSNGNLIANNIISDINTIKAGITTSLPPIGTAQTQNTWMTPQSIPNGFLQSINFVGANIYPFFGGVSDGVAAANDVPITLQQITNTLQHNGYTGSIAVTEEGFPSGGIQINTFPAQNAEKNYYLTWKSRNDNFDSYYFSMYDLHPDTQYLANNPNNYFGLCDQNGMTKDASMLICPQTN